MRIDVLAYMTFPAQHQVKLHSTNQLQSRYMQVEAMAELNTQLNEAQPAQIPPRAA